MASLAQHPEQVIASRPAKRIAWPDLAIILIAFVIQVPLVLNADLGWLLTVCEKMLGGARLGKDIIELNPPLSVLIYMPAAYLGTILPIPAHLFVIVMVLVAAIGSTQLTMAALATSEGDDAVHHRTSLVLLAVFTLVPGATFAQREHICVLGIAPLVALAAAYAAGRTAPVRTSLRVAIGTGAAIAMCLKPPFALVVALPLLWAACRQKSLRPLLGLECWIAGILVVAYFGWAYFAFPEYFSIYPRMAAVAYLPLRMPASFFVLNAGVLCSASALAIMLHLTCGRDPAKWLGLAPWLLAALSGYVSYVLQGKGFSYTRLPIVTFGMLGPLMTPAFLSRRLLSKRSLQVMLTGLVLAIWLLPDRTTSADLQRLIQAEAPPHPKLLMVGSNGSVAEPLVRKVGGEWGGAQGAQLLSGGAGFQLEGGGLSQADQAIAQQIVTTERSRFRNDLRDHQPDVVLIDSVRFGRAYDWEAWARTDPAISQALNQHYRLRARVNGVGLWLRKPDLKSGA